MRRVGCAIILAGVLCFGLACRPKVKAKAVPLNPLPAQAVTITISSEDPDGIAQIQVRVNGSLVKTCTNTSSCSHIDSYPAFDQDFVSYEGTAIDNDGFSADVGPYTFAVGRPWNNQTWIPVRSSSLSASDAIDVCFARDPDYGAAGGLTIFLADVAEKIYERYMETDRINENESLYRFFYTASTLSADDCGGSLSNVAVMAQGSHCNAFAILHEDNFRDCSSNGVFTAEGDETQAFIHESGHAIFGLADEYEGTTSYFFAAPHPNIFPDFQQGAGQWLCQAEVSGGLLNPSSCNEFCDSPSNCGNGWWRHDTMTTIMVRGLFTDAWGLQPRRQVDWVHQQYY
jgi:hypothetical protein